MRRMMRTLASMGMLACAASVTPSAHTCQGENIQSDHLLRILRTEVRDTAAANKTFKLPPIDPSKVALVSDPRICLRAGEAIDSLSRVWSAKPPKHRTSTSPIYVFQVGSSHVVSSGSTAGSGDDTMFFFDSLWRFTAAGVSE